MAIFNMTAGNSSIPITGDDTAWMKVKEAAYIKTGPSKPLWTGVTSAEKSSSINRESGAMYYVESGATGNLLLWDEEGIKTKINLLSSHYLPASSFNDDDGFLYTVAYASNSTGTKKFYKIDISNGTLTLINSTYVSNVTDIAAKGGTYYLLGWFGTSSSGSSNMYYWEIDINTGAITTKYNAVAPPDTTSYVHVSGELGVTGSGNVLGYYHDYIWNISDTITTIRARDYTTKSILNAVGFFVGADERLALAVNPHWNDSSGTYSYTPTGTYLLYDDENQTFIDKGDITLPETRVTLSVVFGMNNGKLRENVKTKDGMLLLEMDKLYTLTTK